MKIRRLASGLTHLSVVLILIGAAISYTKEVKFSFVLPVDEGYIVSEVPLKSGKIIDFGFGLTLKKFEIFRYKPDFALYQPAPAQNKNRQKNGYKLYRKARISSGGILDFGPYGKFTVKKLYEKKGNPPCCTVHLASEAGGEIVLIEGSQRLARKTLKNGYTLKLLKPVDRQYKATLRLIADDNTVIEREMAINKPVDFNGWRFYLNSYGPQSLNYIIVTARRDPGRKIAIAGMFGLMIGITTFFYFVVPRKIKNHIIRDTDG